MIRSRPLLALTAAELISQLGSSLSGLALPWFVLVTTHSTSRMGLDATRGPNFEGIRARISDAAMARAAKLLKR